MAAASIGAVAERADVSRGSVLHHFGDADGLLGAVVDQVLEAIEFPDESVLTEGAPLAQRSHEFVAAMARFYDRSTDWWEVFRRDMDRPDLQAREQDFWASVARLQAAALGSRAGKDRIAAGTLGAILHPWTFGTLRAAGLSLDEAIDSIADLVVVVVQRQEGSE